MAVLTAVLYEVIVTVDGGVTGEPGVLEQVDTVLYEVTVLCAPEAVDTEVTVEPGAVETEVMVEPEAVE